MTPVTQTKLHDKEKGVRGNCLAASLASVLDVPICLVPAFEEMHVDEWWNNLNRWLRLIGYEMKCEHWPKENEHPAGVYYLANGMSPRGVRHSTVWKDGTLAHDPHPSRAGLVGEIEAVWWLEPIGAGR